MKRLVIILLMVLLFSQVYCERVVMKDDQEFEGFIMGKIEGKLYLSERKLYELPIESIYRIYKGKKDVTRKWLEAEDFQDFKFGDWRYPLAKYERIEKADMIEPKAEVDIDKAIHKEELLNMSDREFAIYELEQRQRQADELSRKIDRVSNTMWTIWGVSIGVSIIAVIAAGA